MTWGSTQMTFDASTPTWDASSWITPSGVIWPDPSSVALGVQYGPTGVEYTGTMVGGGISQNQMDELLYAIANAPATPLTGPNDITISVVDDETGEPLEGARVKLHRPGVHQSLYAVLGGGGTIASAAFTVVDATWQTSVTADGFNGASGTIVVPSELTKEIRLTAVSVLVSDDPNLCTGILKLINQYGGPIPGESVQVRIVGQEFAASSYIDNINRTHTTNVNGEIIITLINASSFVCDEGVYEITLGDGRGKRTFRIGAPTSDGFIITQKL